MPQYWREDWICLDHKFIDSVHQFGKSQHCWYSSSLVIAESTRRHTCTALHTHIPGRCSEGDSSCRYKTASVTYKSIITN